MKQRNLMLIAGGLTAFILVMVGGVMAMQSPTEAAAPAGETAVSAGEIAAPAGNSVALDIPIVAEQPANEPISADLAATIAKNVAPVAVQKKAPELVLFEGVTAYEVVTDRGNVYVDAATGEVLYNGAYADVIAAYSEEEEYEEYEGYEREEDEEYEEYEGYEGEEYEEYEDDDDD